MTSNGLSELSVAEDDLESQLRLSQPLLHHHLRRLRRTSSNSTSQVAIIGTNICPIESLDYEIIENDIFKQDWRSGEKIQMFQYLFMKWILCFFIGVLVSLVGFCNNLAVENLAGVKFVVTSNLMLARRFIAAFLVFGFSNFGLTLFATSITTFIAPEAAGSGIPEVKAYLNGVDTTNIFVQNFASQGILYFQESDCTTFDN